MLHGHRDELEGSDFYGFVAIRDPLRADVPEAMAGCRGAGIRVIMITGDDVQTARAIGHGIGLVPSLDDPIDDAGLRSADEPGVQRTRRRRSQAAAAEPADRRPGPAARQVSAGPAACRRSARWSRSPATAPTMRRREEGRRRCWRWESPARKSPRRRARSCSSTIRSAPSFGRSTGADRCTRTSSASCSSSSRSTSRALAITFLGILLFDVRAPFTVLQLLWINVIMDTFASIALCSEPPRDGLMSLPPKRRGEPIVTPAMTDDDPGDRACSSSS